MILTTTNLIEGHTIQDYLGIVTGVHVSMPKTTLTFSMSKYYNSYADKVNEVKEAAFQKLKDNAVKLNANAVVGISIDVESNDTTGVIMISVTGTAVNVI